MTGKNEISIACASAFWGDTPYAVPQLLTEPVLDYICFDYLSEVTMTLLARFKKKDPSAGYIPDFMTDVIEPHLETCLKRKIKLVSNAGALNPEALKLKIEQFAMSQGLSPKVVCITGDDLLAAGLLPDEVRDLNQKPWNTSAFLTANAYIGAPALVAALKADADIIITGRIVDTALVLAPLVYEFGWSWNDYDLLAQGSLAGHIIECGTQCTGGNFTDWQSIPHPENVGFPIIRVKADGEFVVTKAPQTGGLVTPATIAEQIVYEIGDPRSYMLPDVVCDFTNVTLTNHPSGVLVSGAKGRCPTQFYKVSATIQVGWKLSTSAVMKGGSAPLKGEALNQILLQRCENLIKAQGFDAFTEVRSDVIGEGDQTVLRLAAAHTHPKALEILAKEVAPAATSLAPGLTSLLGGRAQPSPRVALVSFLIEKNQIKIQLSPTGECKIPQTFEQAVLPTDSWKGSPNLPSTQNSVKLGDLAYARSGDKGNDVNIGVIAREAKYLPIIKSQLTPQRVADFFSQDFDSPTSVEVLGWELPGLNALNYLLKNCLGGGGAFSLSIDPQGKAFAQRLLQMPIFIEGAPV